MGKIATGKGVSRLDEALFRLINGHAGSSAALDTVFLLLTAAGNGGKVWGLVALVLILGAGRLPGLRGEGFARWRAAGVSMVISLVGAGLMQEVLKQIFRRPRPPLSLADVHVLGSLPESYSFPSGHALSSFAAAAALMAALRHARRTGRPLGPLVLGWCALLLAGLIAFSRVWVGHHYPLDVTAGALLGLLTGWVSWRFQVWKLERRGEQKTAATRSA